MNAPANLVALDAFRIDGYAPFMKDPLTSAGLLTEAHGLTKVLGEAFSDAAAMCGREPEAGLDSLNSRFIASAMGGIGSLIAMALFLQEQGS